VRFVTVLAGAAAIVSSVLQFGSFFLDGFGIAEDRLVLAWNVLLIPAALVLGVSLARRAPVAAIVATVCGVASLTAWAAGIGAGMASIPEWSWIGLSVIWWLGLGVALWPGHRAFALFTLVVGLAALGDVAVTFPESSGVIVPADVYGIVGGAKLPLAMLWAVVIGVAMVAGLVGRLPTDDTAPSLATGAAA
jgi:hypothetical protein